MSLQRTHSLGYGVFRSICVVLALALIADVVPSAAQNAKEDATYAEAVHQTAGVARISALERFLATYPRSARRADALALLAWAYDESGNGTSALNAANELLSVDANNAVALAILADRAQHSASNSKGLDVAALRRRGEQGLAAYAGFRAPAGISAAESYRIQRRTLAMLERSLGFAALQQKDYSTAQTYLRPAVQIDPENSESVYSLALADLLAKPANASEGYMLLARAVRLSQRTSAGTQIAQFARQQYLQAGGTSQDWDRYLAAAGVEADTVTAAPTPAPASVVAASAAVPEKTPDATRRKVKSTKSDVPELPRSARADTEPAPPPRMKPRPSASAPISLGVVIEASQIGGKHDAIIDGLLDMLGYLRQGDEAFILAFGREIDFTQDLTASRRELEDALANLKQQQGTALYEAVGVAAGHLKRIAKNQNRVLLVISDGHNTATNNATFELESNLDEVRVFCIGVGVNRGEDQRLLQVLAQRTGGQAAFVASTKQFGTASDAIARSIYTGGM